MNTFESASSPTVCARTVVFIGCQSFQFSDSFFDHTRSHHDGDVPQLAGKGEPVHPDARTAGRPERKT
jgi:hypothetical protein